MNNKYFAKKQIYKGKKFDSKKELARFIVLEKLQAEKKISYLELHPIYPLMVNGFKIGKYTADFRYRDLNGNLVVEDVKSKITRTRDYILRKKILATYQPPILIKEII